ncbi:hypothetical protein JXA12_05115 [Candidatus Woesearchaeota archaeon]|nr:hypothetical protein [Candidatus Woesearchaeota archaeon]
MKELERQGAHVILGTLILIGQATGLLCWHDLLALLILCAVAVLYAYTAFGGLASLIEHFDREHAIIPGWGALTLVAGSLLSTLLFPRIIASAAIAVLVYADGAATLIGHYAGKQRLWWNKDKTLIGTAAGFLAGFLAANLFLSWQPALVASGVAMLAETAQKPWWLDDNLLIPLATGAALLFLP